MMVTLTIDPALFGSASEAYFYVREQRGISRLVRGLDALEHVHSRRYFCVLEFQEKTEFAHFHLLLDASYIPKRAIDAERSRLRPKHAAALVANRPSFGMTRFSKRHFEGGPEHAARYATKYLVKVPEYGWPSWVLALGARQRVPRYSTNRGFWGSLRSEPASLGGKRRRGLQTYADRVGDCGSTCNVFEHAERIDPSTGEVSTESQWRARVDAPWSSVDGRFPPVGRSKRRVTIQSRDIGACLTALGHVAGKGVRMIAPKRWESIP